MAEDSLDYGSGHLVLAVLLTILCIGAIPLAIIGSNFEWFRKFCERKSSNKKVGAVRMTDLERSLAQQGDEHLSDKIWAGPGQDVEVGKV